MKITELAHRQIKLSNGPYRDQTILLFEDEQEAVLIWFKENKPEIWNKIAGRKP